MTYEPDSWPKANTMFSNIHKPTIFSIKDFFFNGKKGSQSNVSRQIDKYIGWSTRSTVRKKFETKKPMKWQGDIAFLFLIGLFFKGEPFVQAFNFHQEISQIFTSLLLFLLIRPISTLYETHDAENRKRGKLWMVKRSNKLNTTVINEKLAR